MMKQTEKYSLRYDNLIKLMNFSKIILKGIKTFNICLSILSNVIDSFTHDVCFTQSRREMCPFLIFLVSKMHINKLIK